MLTHSPDLQFKGIGGRKMIDTGLHSLEDINKMAVMGFVEIIRHLNFFQQLSKRVINQIGFCQPCGIILIDYPGFNLRLAKKIKEKFDIPITYYISPQLWAWKENRIKIIRQYIDQMLVIFPFEVIWYKDRGVNVKFVGHPIFDDWSPTSKEELCNNFNLNSDNQVITLYPGSRLQEVKNHLPILIQAAELLRKKDSSLQFILGASPQIDWGQWILPDWIHFESESPQKALECADLAFVASGTATFEAAIYGTPMVIIYKMALISWWISKLLIKVPYAGMVNIIAEKEIMPELIQENANLENLFSEATLILKNPEKLEKMKADLNKIKHQLNGSRASNNAAKHILGIN